MFFDFRQCLYQTFLQLYLGTYQIFLISAKTLKSKEIWPFNPRTNAIYGFPRLFQEENSAILNVSEEIADSCILEKNRKHVREEKIGELCRWLDKKKIPQL